MAETTGTGSRLFQLQVISPERVMLDTNARSIQVEAMDGQLGVLYNHAPLVTALVPGVLGIVDESGTRQELAVGEGFLEVFNNHVKVLVDSAETPDQIDVERAQNARRRAEERLSHRGVESVDYARAQAALRRAISRLRTVHKI